MSRAYENRGGDFGEVTATKDIHKMRDNVRELCGRQRARTAGFHFQRGAKLKGARQAPCAARRRTQRVRRSARARRATIQGAYPRGIALNHPPPATEGTPKQSRAVVPGERSEPWASLFPPVDTLQSPGKTVVYHTAAGSGPGPEPPSDESTNYHLRSNNIFMYYIYSSQNFQLILDTIKSNITNHSNSFSITPHRLLLFYQNNTHWSPTDYHSYITTSLNITPYITIITLLQRLILSNTFLSFYYYNS